MNAFDDDNCMTMTVMMDVMTSQINTVSAINKTSQLVVYVNTYNTYPMCSEAQLVDAGIQVSTCSGYDMCHPR